MSDLANNQTKIEDWFAELAAHQQRKRKADRETMLNALAQNAPKDPKYKPMVDGLYAYLKMTELVDTFTPELRMKHEQSLDQKVVGVLDRAVLELVQILATVPDELKDNAEYVTQRETCERAAKMLSDLTGFISGRYKCC